MLKVTRWSPDTCSCIIDYQWDDTLPNDQITLTPVNIVQRCTAHESLQDTNSVYDAVNEENPRKNKALDEILQNAPSNTWYDIDANSGQRIFKNNIGINWSWSGTAPNRTITLTFSGVTLTNQQKNTLQTRLNNRFGNGKVILA